VNTSSFSDFVKAFSRQAGQCRLFPSDCADVCCSKFAQVDHESEVVRTLSTDAVDQAIKEFKEGIDWDDDDGSGDEA
jgi:hypothetical protein